MNPRPPPCEGSIKIDKQQIEEYLNIIELQGFCTRHNKEVKRILNHYLNYTNYRLDKKKTITYLKSLQSSYSVDYYKKQAYQIIRLLRHYKLDWSNEIKLPPLPTYYPKYITKETIESTLKYFEGYDYSIRFKAIIHLGIDSGLRAEELFQLIPEDIDLDTRIVKVNHNPRNGQSTKTKQSRISFYTDETKDILSEYLNYFYHNNTLSTLFPQSWMERKFRKAPIQVKYLRKYFSQEWDRCGGPTSIKKILMGHSLKGDVDLMHYNAQSPEDLKKIYDKVMSEKLV